MHSSQSASYLALNRIRRACGESSTGKFKIRKEEYLLDSQLGQYFRYDENFESWMDPIRHIQTSQTDDLEPEFLVDEFQNQLHSMLESYLNGQHLANTAKLLYPLIYKANPQTRRRLAQTVGLLEKLYEKSGNREIYRSLEKVRGLGHPLSRDGWKGPLPAQPLCEFHNLFRSVAKDFGNPNAVEVQIEPLHFSDYMAPELKPVLALSDCVRSELSSFLEGFYIHGSMADLSYTGYSDLDTLMVVSGHVFSDWKKLRRLARVATRSTRFLYTFDPLQHHGHMVISEIDLERFPEAYFPTVVLAHARRTTESGSSVKFRLRPCSRESKRHFWRMVQSFRRFILEEKGAGSPYQVKGLLSRFMLLPALYLQALGEPCYKGDSFGRVERLVDSPGWAIMHQATRTRQDWQYSPDWIMWTLCRLGSIPWIRVCQKRRRRPVRQAVLTEDAMWGMFHLSEALWRSLCARTAT